MNLNLVIEAKERMTTLDTYKRKVKLIVIFSFLKQELLENIILRMAKKLPNGFLNLIQ
jgi:hypothetical protein